jgi:hypothetical protein
MASPFTRFRKHQKRLLVFLGVALMISFGFGGSFMILPNLWGERAARDQIVVETKSESFTEAQLGQLMAARREANRFIQFVQAKAGNITFDRQGNQRFAVPSFGPIDEESVLDTHLMAQKAEALGIVISDKAIEDFINNDLAKGRLTDADYDAILADLDDLPVLILYEILRKELMAQQLFVSFFSDAYITGVSPAERWDYYQRLHRRSHVEVLPIEVARFLDRVPTPSDEDLEKLFQEGRFRFPDPNSAEPAFRQPHLASFQAVMANFNSFYEKELAKVTPEEIEKYYNENLSKFPYSEFDPIDASGFPIEAPDPQDDSPVLPPAGDDGTPKEKGAPARGTPQESPPPEGAAALLQPPCGFESLGQVMPVAYQATGGNQAAGAARPAGGTQPATGDPPAGGNPAAAATQPAAGNPPAGGQSPPATGAASTTAPAEKTLLQILAENRIPTDIRGGPNPPHNPLWKVEKTIREQLARERANKEIARLFDEIRKPMEQYSAAWNEWATFAEDNPNLKRPADVPLADLAQARGLTLLPTTPMLDPRALYEDYKDSELGRSVVQREGGPRALIQVAYAELTEFEPAVAEDDDGNQYLFWKVKERKDFIPETLAEVKDQVLHAWRMIEARQLALSKARSVAAEARSTNTSLTEMEVLGRKGLKVAPFTWITQANLFSRMTASEVEGVERPGEEFRRTVYNTKAGDVAVAMNAPQTICYVIRVTDVDYVLGGAKQDDVAIVRRDFYADPFRTYQQIAQAEQMGQIQDWLKALRAEAGVKWLRPPRVSLQE